MIGLLFVSCALLPNAVQKMTGPPDFSETEIHPVHPASLGDKDQKYYKSTIFRPVSNTENDPA
jgi:hypothetical protein